MSVFKAKSYPDSVNQTQITWMVSSCSWKLHLDILYHLWRISAILIVSRQFQYCSDSFNTVRTVSILSGRFQYCPDVCNAVRTASILFGRLEYCPDGYNTVHTFSTLSGRLEYCPDDFNTVRKVLLSTVLYARGVIMSQKVYLRASSRKILRGKSCCPESFCASGGERGTLFSAKKKSVKNWPKNSGFQAK